MKKQMQKGFTLIELMIVVAIIGILAAVALPAYQDYVIKAKMSEVVLAASGCRTAVSEIYQTMDAGDAPGANNWGCGEGVTTTQYVSAIATDANGAIRVTIQGIDAAVNGQIVILTPETAAATPAVIADIPVQLFGFDCAPAVPATLAKYLPGSCK